MGWLNQQSPQVQAAIIAAIITLVGIILRDAIFKMWEERRISKKTTLDIYKRYADPLAVAATSLMWRLYEVFYIKGRKEYLMKPRTEFEHYKKISTLYRVAALIGWIRGFRRELSFLQAYDRTRIKPIEDAIEAFEAALAEGQNVERRRFEEICKLWNLEVPDEEGCKESLAIALNNVLKPNLHSAEARIAADLSGEMQAELCNKLATILCSKLGLNPLSGEIIVETKARAIRCLSIKEAWLYRDWQIAIGDLMLMRSEYEGRAFEVIGFGEFESRFSKNLKEDGPWFQRLSRLLDGLDISGADRFDARIEQLRNILIATAKLVTALARVQHGERFVSEATIKKSQEILNSE